MDDGFSRREFLGASTAALGVLPFGLGRLLRGGDGDSIIGDPIGALCGKLFPTLVAFLEAQMQSLWCGPPGDCPREVARDYIRYVSHLPKQLQQGIVYSFIWFDLYALRHEHRLFHKLSCQQRRRLLNQGETQRRNGDPPLIRWSEDHLVHLGIGSLAMIGRLVTLSRRPARELIGLFWSPVCQQVEQAVHVPEPPAADLDVEYDMCVIGSGAGGAVAAARAAEAGLRVLIVEAGQYISPDRLVERYPQDDGTVRLYPPRSDQVLIQLYKDAGAQIAGGMDEIVNPLNVVIPPLRKSVRPQQTINVLQAEVVGGGPYVNNAIHLKMKRHVWDSWGGHRPRGITYDELSNRMDQVNERLGVNQTVTDRESGERSLRFVQGCNQTGADVQPVPVSIRLGSTGCGADNSIDPYGDHVGGIHPYRPDAPNSYLMRALHAPVPAQVASKTRAVRTIIRRDAEGNRRADCLEVIDSRTHRCGQRRRIRAKQYVVAAGVGATASILRASLATACQSNRFLGTRLTANVGTAIYAMYDKPIVPAASERPEPGVTQCFVVERRMEEVNGRLVEVEPTLENWFHFPGTVAIQINGWFERYGQVMRRYNHLSMAGLVTPTHVRPQNRIAADGKFELSLDGAEFERLLRGLRKLGGIYLATSTPEDSVQLLLPTKAILLRHGRPVQIRTVEDLDWAIAQIRCRGPAFVNMLTAHPQGGAPLGHVVDQDNFQLRTDHGQRIENVHVCDASVFPAGCEINPQLTVKAIAEFASDRMLAQSQPLTPPHVS